MIMPIQQVTKGVHCIMHQATFVGICMRNLRENHDLKEEMILCLASLVRDTNSEECGCDEEWLKLIDRGALYHVKETTFQLFCAIENEAMSVLEALTKPCSASKLVMIKKITE